MIPSTAIRDVTLLDITYETTPRVWGGKEVRVPASYLVRIGDTEFTLDYDDCMEWEPDPYPTEPEIGSVNTLYVRRSWARAHGFSP